jgi:hypothetical protein
MSSAKIKQTVQDADHAINMHELQSPLVESEIHVEPFRTPERSAGARKLNRVPSCQD